MKISKTQINNRLKRKTNPELVETIILAKKHGLLKLAAKLSGSTRTQIRANIEDLNNEKEEKIIVAGKVLGSGEINKKKKIYATGFSEQAKEKLKKAGCEYNLILDSLKKKEKLEGKLIG